MGDIFDGIFESYFNDTQPKSDRLLGESNSFYAQDHWLFAQAATSAVFLQIRGAQHVTGTDLAWTVLTPEGRDPALAFNTCLVWFFDTYLKGEAPPLPTNSEIYNVQRK